MPDSSSFLSLQNQILIKYLYRVTCLLVFLLPLRVLSQVDTLSDWKLGKEKNGISVYTRMMEDSKFKEYKSIGRVEASPEELVELLMEVEEYTEWMDRVIIAEMVKADRKDVFYIYTEVKVPWPFDNRDQVTKSLVTRDPESGVITLEVTIVPGFRPEKDGVVRLTTGSGCWVFTPLENGNTEVYHRFGADPGGTIPAWVVNMFLVDGPYKNMIGIQKMLKGED
jgi:hypothetical protein